MTPLEKTTSAIQVWQERIQSLEKQIDQTERTLRAKHVERLNSGKCKPYVGVAFIDILSNLERVGDHAHNIAYIVKDIEKIHRKQNAKKI